MILYVVYAGYRASASTMHGLMCREADDQDVLAVPGADLSSDVTLVIRNGKGRRVLMDRFIALPMEKKAVKRESGRCDCLFDRSRYTVIPNSGMQY